MSRRMLTIVTAATLLAVPTVHAKVLCTNKKGAAFVRDACKSKETPVDAAALGLTGPQGAQGVPGTPGIQGPPGEAGSAGLPGPGAKWALVGKDGTILAQSGGLSATLVANSTANYSVDFGESLANKVLQVSAAIVDADNTFTGTAIVGRCGGGATGLTCDTNNDDRHALVVTSSFVINQGPPVGASFVQSAHTFFVAAF